MTAKWLNAIGIFLTMGGTILTLWTILVTDPRMAGTYKELKDRHELFPKEQSKVRIGCGIIAVGGILQIIGQFL